MEGFLKLILFGSSSLVSSLIDVYQTCLSASWRILLSSGSRYLTLQMTDRRLAGRRAPPTYPQGRHDSDKERKQEEG